MLYAARECARIALTEGLEERFVRHNIASEAVVSGLEAMGLEVFGDQSNKMPTSPAWSFRLTWWVTRYAPTCWSSSVLR